MKRPPGNTMLQRARGLRRELTPQEAILWGQLRGRRFEGFKFRQQMWLRGFVADFACPEARLVVEADGSQHADDADYDAQRATAFARAGWRTLRFWKYEIRSALAAVLIAIRPALPSPSHPAVPDGPLHSGASLDRPGDGPVPAIPCRERGL